MKNKKKTILLLTVVVLVLLSLSYFFFFKSPGAGDRGQPEDYNIVMIVSDSLRVDVMNCYGGDVATPNLNRLAREGMLFERAYSTAPCTMPASVSMFTGNYSRAYGIVRKKEDEQYVHKYSFYVNDSDKLLAEVLNESGFDVKKEVENPLAGRSNNLQGFSPFRPFRQMSKEEKTRVEEGTGIRNIGLHEKRRVASRYDAMYDFLHYLLTVPKEQNFFLLKWFLNPHSPYNPPGKYRDKIDFDQAKLPREEIFYREGSYKKIAQLFRQREISTDELFYLNALYKAEIEIVDEKVGYVMDVLKKRGLMDKTFIVFTSDHGELFGEHDRLGHGGAYYEGLVRIPLIIAGPGIPKGKREKTVVSNIDIMPTLKELMGVTYPIDMKGKSYCDLFRGKPIRDRNPYFDRITTNIKKKPYSDAMIVDGYKLIVNKVEDRHVFTLYNLEEDPGETTDISAGNRHIVKKIFKELRELRKENQARLKQNLAKIDKNVNLDKEQKKTLKALKSLGYM